MILADDIGERARAQLIRQWTRRILLKASGGKEIGRLRGAFAFIHPASR